MSKRKRERKKQKELRHQQSSKKATPGAGVPVAPSARGGAAAENAASGRPAADDAVHKQASGKRGKAADRQHSATVAGAEPSQKGQSSPSTAPSTNGEERAPSRRGRKPKVAQATEASGTSSNGNGQSAEWQAFYRLVHDAAIPFGNSTESVTRK